MVRASAVAICAAVLTLSPSVRADQLTFIEALRVQGGYFTEARPLPSLEPRIHDPTVTAAPSVSMLWFKPAQRLTLTYTLTGALHGYQNRNELNNQGALLAAFDLSKRTTMLINAHIVQTTLTNYLLNASPATNSTVTLLTPTYSRVVTGGVTETLQHSLSPELVFSQNAGIALFTALAPTLPLDTASFTGGVGLERLWREDGIGFDVNGGYVLRRTAPPLFVGHFYTLSASPHWRHDWSKTISTNVSAGASAVFSPDPGTSTAFGPNGHAALQYTDGRYLVEASATTGFTPSQLTAQLVRSTIGAIHGSMPLSERNRVILSGGFSYGRSTLVDLTEINPEITFDSYTSNVDVSWQVASLVQLFARYQFIGQLGDVTAFGTNPSVLRDTFAIGVLLTSRPPFGERGGGKGGKGDDETVETSFPKRVDKADGLVKADAAELDNPGIVNRPTDQDETVDPAHRMFESTTNNKPPNVPMGQEKPVKEKPAKDDD